MMIKFSHQLQMRFAAALVVLGLVAGFAGSAEASGPGPSPSGYIGACNMLQDATMWTIPMTHDAPQGNVGMFHAVAVSGGCV